MGGCEENTTLEVIFLCGKKTQIWKFFFFMVSYEENTSFEVIFFTCMVSYEENLNLEVIFFDFMVNYEENRNLEVRCFHFMVSYEEKHKEITNECSRK